MVLWLVRVMREHALNHPRVGVPLRALVPGMGLRGGGPLDWQHPLSLVS